jgi:hypothetical protein
LSMQHGWFLFFFYCLLEKTTDGHYSRSSSSLRPSIWS